MSNFTRKVCKLFSSDFGKLVDRIEEAYNEHDKREKKRLYLEIKNKFDELKEEKRKSCNNIKKVDKKIDLISLMIIVLEYDIDINKSNMVRIYHELDLIEKELNNVNISINTINKGEKLVRKKIKDIYENIEFTTNVKIKISNLQYQANENKKKENESKKLVNSLQERLTRLHKGGKRKTRKYK
jgi:hypothetical protein